MKIKTSHIIYGGILLCLLGQGDNVRQSLEKGNQLRHEQTVFGDRLRESKMQERQAEALSKVALGRFKNNCILVDDKTTRQPTYFESGQEVIDRTRGVTVRPGAFACNLLGETALVAEDGTLTDIARIATPDLPAFRKLLKVRENAK